MLKCRTGVLSGVGSILSKVYHAKWAILGFVLLLVLLMVLGSFLNVIVYGIFLYYITRPIRDRLHPYIKNRTILVSVCLLAITLPIVVVIAYTLLQAISELSVFLSNNDILYGVMDKPLADLSRSLSQDGLREFLGTAQQSWHSLMTSAPAGVMSTLKTIAFTTGTTFMSLIFRIFLVILFAFYLLRDDIKLKSWFESSFPQLMEEHDGLFRRYCRHVDTDLEKIFFGNLLSILFFAVVAITTFLLLNTFVPPYLRIPNPVMLGLLCGVAALVPIVAMWAVLVPLYVYLFVMVILSGSTFGFMYLGVMIFVIFMVVQLLPDYIIRPFISHGSVHMGLLIFAYVLGPVVFGISGVFLGAIALVLLVNYLRMVLPPLLKEKV